MDQQCVLNSRHTDCTDLETLDNGPKKSACVVSSVLGIGLLINTLISRGRKTWAGVVGARGVGAWLGNHGQNWTSM